MHIHHHIMLYWNDDLRMPMAIRTVITFDGILPVGGAGNKICVKISKKRKKSEKEPKLKIENF